MKNILIISIAMFGLALAGCSNPLIEIDDTDVWRTLTGSTGIGFWGLGNDPYKPQALLVFIRTPFVTRIEYWEGYWEGPKASGEKIRSAEWLDISRNSITYRAPNGLIISQTYSLEDNGLWLYALDISLTSGGYFWRRERPSWWSWEFDDSWPNLTGSSYLFTGSDGIGFWGGGGSDPDNPNYLWVFINTPSVSRVEYWINQELFRWGHWIDATGNTIIYRQHDHLNPTTQRYRIETDRLWLDGHFAAIAWSGAWRRFEGPEWWTLEER